MRFIVQLNYVVFVYAMASVLLQLTTYLIFFFTAEEDSMLPFNDKKKNKCSFDNLKTTVPKDC